MFKLEIETDNDAFGTSAHSTAREVARILRRLATRLDDGATDGRIMDVNGNSVGHFDLEREL